MRKQSFILRKKIKHQRWYSQGDEGLGEIFSKLHAIRHNDM